MKKTPPARRQRDVPSIAPVGFDEQHHDTISHSLAILSTVYHYNHWIFDSIRDYLGNSIVEIGSGMGNISQFLLNVERLVCVEPFAPYHAYLAQRFARHLNVTVCALTVEQCPHPEIPARSFDSVVCLNVLEHIEDDVGALGRMRELLMVGGRLVVLVPAIPWVYGSMDSAMGHVRRYTRASLMARFRTAGLMIETARYFNFPGLLGWWWHGRVLRRDRLSPASTRLFDRLVPYVSAIERLAPIPAGQSVLVVGRRERA